MDQELDKKIEFIDRIISFFKNNKRKIIILLLIIFLIIFSIIIFKTYEKRKNLLISEKYIQAGIYLNLDKKNDAKKLLDEIISSKNSFYSILSLNLILERELVSDNNKILEYFDLIEKNTKNKSQNDLLILKKALYLIKISQIKEGQSLLKQLVKNNSKYKNIAKEIIE
tara:strand:+ start:361 stop:867 length:507 start_codon:yes stop_codon:yes gene_type:complete